jgi:hypothetical protein
MKRAAKTGGRIYITFGPPWFAPYGSHMHFFTKVPWVNILFSERTVMNVRRLFRQDGAARYIDVESGLNKMSLARFDRIVRGSGLRVEWRTHELVKGIDALRLLPFASEFFVNRVNCALRR